MTTFLPYLWQLAWAWLLQVLLFRHGVLWGGAGVFLVHLVGVLRLPTGLPPTTYLVVAALGGAAMDVVCMTGGVHLAASATLGMAYPSMLAAFEPRDGFRPGHSVNPFLDGWTTYAMYVASACALYALVLFGLQNGWNLMGRTLVHTLATTALNVGVFLAIQGLLNRPSRRQSQGPTAYPWN